jgi:hypothetical protein
MVAQWVARMDVHDFPGEAGENLQGEIPKRGGRVGPGPSGRRAGCQGGAKGVPRRCQGGAKASTKKGNDDESDPHIIIYIYTDTYPEADTVDIYIYVSCNSSCSILEIMKMG